MTQVENTMASAGAAARALKSEASTNVAAELSSLLERMKAAQKKSGPPDYDTRIAHLDKLERVLLSRKHDLARAVSADFGNRSARESLAAEVLIVQQGIKHTRAHLHEWMETEPRDVSWLFMPGRAEVVMQPVGVVGIISPWNYPIQLALAPLVCALAAGNRAMLKPSEASPETSELLKTMLADMFAPEHVAVVTGGVAAGEAFARLPFDHLLFTGSTRVGKIVMKAAAENLVPVTLELGGKSPAIVGEGYSLAQAAIRIMFGKCLNAGQTCVAPDYVFVPKSKVDAFVQECKAATTRMFASFGGNEDYTSIISERHLERLRSLVDEAKSKGASVVELSSEGVDAKARKMPPVLLLDAKDDTMVMQDEIFGPILPVRTYEALDEVIAYVNERPRPLALYYFDNDQRRIDKVLRETVSGGVTVNDVLMHVGQDDMPFGGVGASGMGHYHGREGFETFSKKKGVFYQSRMPGTALLRPPYGSRIDFILRALLGR